ncbi:MAG: alpha/beta hydrolase [Alphaproteobacteria bacterium]|nr:alpha/beta hydrolase [Alphaproteobacteria bacterium]MBU1515314.1 alpha/beta hydrolase [Alphaproteobacteria bacterium]MBU2094954.1 alpha/beta hydrolase [Alphaproteobacteria bacterium]MBU2149629.1 alpha/beta hydrolase [Alphaproteobacteria bacterium]MBU2310012.1 alpha/beta hydrolase [Alphaproteobacteria bacterium]
MAFEGFQLSQVETDEVSLRVRHGGSGPPVLLMHGYPETHMMWAKVAEGLARDFTIICPDLRGYGGSTKPPSSDDHETSSKRAMARDAIAVMRHFGFETFDVAGHDRGGRVAYRLALDHPQAVRRVSILDIVPTGEVWGRADRRLALGYWHWSFLAQPHPMPETLIAPDPEYFLFKAQFRGAVHGFDAEAYADYLAAANTPSVIHAMCEDYRAGAGYDRLLDEADRKAGRKIACPVQVLWGGKGALAAWYDTLGVWREWADDVRGQALDCGHFIPEEKPAETLALLRAFFLQGR